MRIKVFTQESIHNKIGYGKIGVSQLLSGRNTYENYRKNTLGKPQLDTLVKGTARRPLLGLIEAVKTAYPSYEQQRHERPGRKRGVGGGQKCDLPLVIRVALGLTYLRLHVKQALVAKFFGASQSDVSRELRRLGPLLKQVLPCPEVWDLVQSEQALTEAQRLKLSDLADDQVLIDATEPLIYRSKDSATRKAARQHVPGAKNDKKLSDETKTVDRLPDECQGKADKGYQGLAEQVTLVTLLNPETGDLVQMPRLTLEAPFKKPKGGELTESQLEFNRLLSTIRVRVEHCIGWVKNWKSIGTRFRCAQQIYTLLMQVVAGLVNWQTQRWQQAKAQMTG